MDAPISSVGRSSRTPVKHFLLNALVGKIVGVLSSGKSPCKANPFYAVDLCGGDGFEPEDGSHEASPHILFKHCNWIRAKHGKESCLDIIEKQVFTFEKLSENCSYMMPHGWVKLINSDASEFVLKGIHRNQAVFIHCDPNSVADMPLTQPMIESWNDYTTYLVTLGCNVGGLKRATLAERLEWKQYVDSLCSVLPKHHDAILFWLNRDAAKWAYLASIPKVWSESFATFAVSNTTKHWPKGVHAASFRNEEKQFSDALQDLFLTKKELGQL